MKKFQHSVSTSVESTIKAFALLVASACTLMANGQTREISLQFAKAQEAEGCKMYVRPLVTKGEAELVEMTSEGTTYSATVATSPEGLYSVTCIRDGAQIFGTISLGKGGGAAKVAVQTAGYCLMATDTPDNKALGSYAQCEAQGLMALWTPGRTADELRTIVTSFEQKADSVVKAYRCTARVEKYVRMWAYTSAYNAYTYVPNILGCKPSEVPFGIEEVMDRPERVMDSPLAATFPIAYQLIDRFMPRGATLSEQMDWLYGNFKCEDIINKVGGAALDKYVARYDYAGKYEQGLAELEAVTAKYALDGKYVRKFRANRVTIPGNPFPEGLTFTDAEGKTHTIDELRGKYVYIDLWASWCGPCCKEVPHLQALEKELQNDGVVFVSISIDAKEEPWKKKMEALQMRGNQWHDPKGLLGQALNVQGIPFFVIYDREGRLLQYNAPRPSHPSLKTMLEGL